MAASRQHDKPVVTKSTLQGLTMNRVAGIGGAIQARSRLMPEGVNIAISSGGVEAL